MLYILWTEGGIFYLITTKGPQVGVTKSVLKRQKNIIQNPDFCLKLYVSR